MAERGKYSYDAPLFNRDEYLARMKYAKDKTTGKTTANGIDEYEGLTANQSQNAQSKGNFVERSLGTIQQLTNKVEYGVYNFFEGIIDFGAGLISGGAKLFGNDDLSDDINNFIKRDISNDMKNISRFAGGAGLVGSIANIVEGEAKYDNFLDVIFGKSFAEQSYTKDNEVGQTIEGMAQSIGQMLPSIAIGAGVGDALQGANVADKFVQFGSKASSLGSMGLSAGGGSLQEAVNEGADIGEALGYGTLSGLTEIGTEIAGDFLGGKIMGAIGDFKPTGKVTSSVLGSTLKRIGKNFTGEGLEEVASDILSPIWKKCTYKKDEKVWDIFQEQGGIKGLFESFIVGGSIGAIFEGVDLVKGSNEYRGKGESFKQGLQKYTAVKEFENLLKIKNDIINAKENFNINDQVKSQAKIDALDKHYNEQLEKFQKGFTNYIAEILDETGSESAKEFKKAYADILDVDYDSRQIISNAFGEEGSGWDFVTTGDSNYNSTENKVYINKADASSVARLAKVITHEGSHMAFSNLTTKERAKVVKGLVSDKYYNSHLDSKIDSLDPSNKATFNDYKDKAKDSPYVKELIAKGYKEANAIKTYIKEEMASERMISDINSISNFKSIVENSNKKGLKKLLNTIKSFTHSETRSKDYKKAMSILEEALKSKDTTASNNEVRYKNESTRNKIEDKVVDSDGNGLTKEQQEYFKDSKVRDEDGKLLKVYHGTQKGGFTIFDGRNDDNYKFGNNFVSYFSSRKDMAQSYGKNHKDVDLNFKKKTYTLSEINTKLKNIKSYDYDNVEIVKSKDGFIIKMFNKNTNKKVKYGFNGDGMYYNDEIEDFIQGDIEPFDTIKEAVNSLESLLSKNNIWYDNFEDYEKDIQGSVYQVYLNITKPLIVSNSLAWNIIPSPFEEDIGKNKTYTTNEIVKKAIELGKYDGVIFKNTLDYGSNLTKSTEDSFMADSFNPDLVGDVYVAISSPNQIKSTDNKKPTKSSDIRYKISDQSTLDEINNAISDAKKQWSNINKNKEVLLDSVEKKAMFTSVTKNIEKVEENLSKFKSNPKEYTKEDLSTIYDNLKFLNNAIKSITGQDSLKISQGEAKEISFDEIENTPANRIKLKQTIEKALAKESLSADEQKSTIAKIKKLIQMQTASGQTKFQVTNEIREKLGLKPKEAKAEVKKVEEVKEESKKEESKPQVEQKKADKKEEKPKKEENVKKEPKKKVDPSDKLIVKNLSKYERARIAFSENKALDSDKEFKKICNALISEREVYISGINEQYAPNDIINSFIKNKELIMKTVTFDDNGRVNISGKEQQNLSIALDETATGLYQERKNAEQQNVAKTKQSVANTENKSYDKSEKGEKKDDTRRVKEENNRESGRKGISVQSNNLERFGEKSKGLREILKDEGRNLRDTDRIRLVNHKTTGETYFTNVGEDIYYELFTNIHKSFIPAMQVIVDVHEKSTYNTKNGVSFISSDGKSVGFIENSGNIISVASNSEKGGFAKTFLSYAVKNGGKYMDCMSSIKEGTINLPYTYSRNGFMPVAKIKFSKKIMLEEHTIEEVNAFIEKYGEADLIFSAYSGESTRLFESREDCLKHIDSLEYVDWDEAVKIRDKYLNSVEKKSSKISTEKKVNKKVEQKETTKAKPKVEQVESQVVESTMVQEFKPNFEGAENVKLKVSIDRNAVKRIQKKVLSLKSENLTRGTIDIIASEIYEKGKVEINGSVYKYSELFEKSDIVEQLNDYKATIGESSQITDYFKKKLFSLAQQAYEYKEFVKYSTAINVSADKLQKRLKSANKVINSSVSKNVTTFQKALSKLFSSRFFSNKFRADLGEFNKTYIESADNKGYTDAGLYYDENIKDALQSISEGKGKLNSKELKYLNTILKSFDTQLRNYANNQVKHKGEIVNIAKESKKYVDVINKNPKIKNNAVLYGLRLYKNAFTDPRSVFASFDNYNINGKGVFTEIYDTMVDCQSKELELKLELLDIFADKEFHKKKFRKHLNERVSFMLGSEQVDSISIDTLMSLYLTASTADGFSHIKSGGFDWQGKNEDMHWKHESLGNITQEEFLKVIESQLSDIDKRYIEKVKKVFEIAKDKKAITDKDIFGTSNVIKGEYYPLTIRDLNGNVLFGDVNTFNQMNNVMNLSFNKNRKSNFGGLKISDSTQIVNSYISGISRYYGYGVEMQYINRLMNTVYIDEESKGGDGKHHSVKWALKDKGVFNSGDGQIDAGKYLNDFLNDAQGLSERQDKGVFGKVLEKIRTNSMIGNLGFNVTSMLRQGASIFGAKEVISYKNIAKAFSKSVYTEASKQSLQYLPSYIKMRFSDNEYVRSAVASETLSDVQQFAMKGLSKMDEATIRKLYEACKFEIESRNSNNDTLKYGTKENAIEAGKLLEEVVRKTQPNYNAIERSSAQRSNNEFIKYFAMYSSQPMKNLSRLVEHIGEYNAYSKAIKEYNSNNSSISKEDLIKGRNEAVKKTLWSLSSIIVQGVAYTLIGNLVKTAFKKKEWDEWKADEIAKELGENSIIGMLPVFKDIYGYFANGRDFSVISMTNINETLGAVKQFTDAVIDQAQGKEVDWGVKTRKLIYSASALAGIPTKNLLSYTNGLVKNFNPELAYKMENIFYTTNTANKDYKEALEKNKMKTASLILEQNFKDNKTGTAPSKDVINAMNNLFKNGYESVIPNSVSDTIQINGVTYKLQGNQKAKIKQVYAKANDVAHKIVTSAKFSSMSDEAKAKALKLAYSTYYDLSKSAIIKDYDTDNKYSLIAKTGVDMSNIILEVANISSIVVTGSNKRMDVVRNYINKLSLSKDEKSLIYRLCGYSLSDNQKTRLSAYLKKNGLNNEQINIIL